MFDGDRNMVQLYMAVALQTSFRGVEKRKEIAVNLDHIHDAMSAAVWLTEVELPVRLIALPEAPCRGLLMKSSI